MRPWTRNILAASLAVATTLAAQAAAAANLIRDAEIERTLKDMSAPIFKAAGFRPQDIHIYILQDRTLNAFVTNGNNMFLHTGLIETLETPEELLGVIAHETGHLAGGHEAQRNIAVRNARGPALLGLLLGIAAGVAGSPEAGAAAIAGSQSMLTRGLLSYSRGEEATADQAAMQYLSRAKIDPHGFLKVLERFRGQEVFNAGNVDPFLLTHPMSTERLQLVERAVADASGKTFPPDPDRDYWYGRMRAKLKGFLDNPNRVLTDLEGKPETEDVLYAKAVALYRQPAIKEGLAATDRLIALRPNDPFYLELKGQILFETAHAEEAVPLYRKAVKLAPDEPLLEGELGRVLLALNNPDADREALAVLKDARQRDLGDAAALRDLATAYSRAGDIGMATLATAERYALVGSNKDAVMFARRASKLLPEGSPGWLRAQDILVLRPESE